MIIDSLAVEVCRRLGLDPSIVSKLVLTFLPNDDVRATVHTLVKQDAVPAFTRIDTYKLERIETSDEIGPAWPSG